MRLDHAARLGAGRPDLSGVQGFPALDRRLAAENPGQPPARRVRARGLQAPGCRPGPLTRRVTLAAGLARTSPRIWTCTKPGPLDALGTISRMLMRFRTAKFLRKSPAPRSGGRWFGVWLAYVGLVAARRDGELGRRRGRRFLDYRGQLERGRPSHRGRRRGHQPARDADRGTAAGDGVPSGACNAPTTSGWPAAAWN